MPNELEISKRNLLLAKARADLAEYEQCVKATEEDAQQAARLIIGFAVNKPADPALYMHGIVHVLRGVPLEIVRKIGDPKRGIVSTSEFVPSMAAINKWLDNELYMHERMAERARSVIFTLETGEEDVSRETSEERAAHVEAALAKVRGTQKDQRIANLEESLKRSGIDFGQRNVGWDKRMEALKNLEATRRVADDEPDTFVQAGDAVK